MPFELPALPWASDALDPHVSARTLGFHHGKHHATYVAKLNEAIEGSSFTKQSLEEIIAATANDASKAGIFNNAAQTWNHTFFWNSMRPNGGGEPEGALEQKIVESFGSFEKFRNEFSTKAATLFGSGWTWLTAVGDKLEIVQTAGAGNPMTDNKTPLLTLDVWEHAYYLDYQNRRPDFIKAFFDSLVNWEFAAKNLSELS
jgi:Fe-Mn family superoxide dismutase